MIDGKQLSESCCGIRIHFNWWGNRRALEHDDQEKVARACGATTKAVQASKKLLQTKHPAFSQLLSLKRDIKGFHRGVTLPYPEPGVRVASKTRVPSVVERFEDFASLFNKLRDEDLAAAYPEIKLLSRAELGDLWDEDDYPDTISSYFGFSWDIVSLNPPDYLLEIAPWVYEQEKAKLHAMCQQAIHMNQKAVAAQFKALVDKLHEKLVPSPDGTKKRLTQPNVDNLKEFIASFKDMDVTNDQDMAALVAQAEQLIGGADVDDIKSSPLIYATSLKEIGESLEVYVAPRRSIVRPKKQLESVA